MTTHEIDPAVVQVRIDPDGFRVNGQRVASASGDTHSAAIRYVAEQVAAPAGRPVTVRAVDDAGTHRIEVTPAGAMTILSDEPGDPSPATEPVQPPTAADTADRAITEPGEHPEKRSPREEPAVADATGQEKSTENGNPWLTGHRPESPHVPPTAATPVSPLHTAAAPVQQDWTGDDVQAPISFLTPTDQEPGPVPATGWAGLLVRLGWRKPAGPTPEQMAERADHRAIAQHWPGPRTIAVINPKGGADKTPTTVFLSAFLARVGGAGVLAWDNNETRGTLGWRTEQGPHSAHVRDLLRSADELLAPDARVADLARYVHHQTEDQYDVLRSDPYAIRPEDRIGADELEMVHRVASRYYRVTVMDSGNNEASPNWLAMIDRADVLVVATTTNVDAAESGRLALENLRQHSRRAAVLADHAVAIVSHGDVNDPDPGETVAKYQHLCGDAVAIPFDRAMRARHLRMDGLAPQTHVAWRRAAATVAHALTAAPEALQRVPS